MFEIEYAPDEFNTLANKILNHVVLIANGHTYRIREIEMYYKNKNHPDDYVHGILDQKSHEKFYFHKYRNGTYKSGTYKGVDIALGNKTTYFGVLIRSIQNLETGIFTEGSCNCVNKIISHFDVTTVKDLMDKYFSDKDQVNVTGQLLYLETRFIPHDSIYKGPRIGLSDKYPDYRNRPYRYATNICQIKKKRKTFIQI